MEIRQLHAFLAVAKELHFGRAAQRLHVAQPPLSKQIRQLEKELGVDLFVRTTRSVTLTSAGEALLGQAERVIAAMEDARFAATAGGSGEYGRVRVGFAGAATRHTLPQLAREVKARYPHIDLALRGNMYANTAQRALLEGDIDLGFVRLPFVTPGLAYRAIEEETLLCVVPTDHELASQPALGIGDLAQYSFVTFPRDAGSTLRSITDRLCWEAGFSPKVVQEAPDSYTIHAMVAAGQGISLTFSSTISINQPGVVYIPVLGDLPRLQSAIAWSASNPSAALRSVLQVADAVFPRPKRALTKGDQLPID